MKDNVYIHMGYGRTGTTWLQNKVFPMIPGIRYLGKNKENYPQWMINWNYLDRLVLPNEIETIRENIYLSEHSNDKVLISSEAFTQTGGIVDQIDRIKTIVNNAKIILVLRDPVKLVISKYRCLLMAGFFKDDIEQYLDYSPTPFDLVRRKRIYLYDYIYPLVIQKIFDEFNSKNTLIIKYEYLEADPKGFIEVILRFLAVDNQIEIDFSPVNESDKSFFINEKTIEELKSFFASLYNYDDFPNYIYNGTH